MAKEKTNWLEIDIVRQAFDQAGQYAMQQAANCFFWQVNFHLTPSAPRPVDSPAEAVFAAWFVAAQLHEREFYLEPQVEVKAGDATYRFDFVVVWRRVFGKPVTLKTAVEIDGHAFHEKTKQQATYRNKRDRDLQAAGYRVLHFSYSELMQDALRCVHEVMEAARAEVSRAEADNVAAGRK